MEWPLPEVLHPMISVLAGIIILIWPTILNYVIAIWLILTGVMSYVAMH